jgi:hypothetical protein
MVVFCSSLKFSRVKLTAKDNLVVKSFNKSNALGKFCALIMSLVPCNFDSEYTEDELTVWILSQHFIAETVAQQPLF